MRAWQTFTWNWKLPIASWLKSSVRSPY